jgi:ParB/RepB/Spo0J family partition protein
MAELISVEKIDKNEWNPNVMQDAEYLALKQDMQTNGPRGVDPILVSPFACFFPGEPVNERFVIVDGEHRWRIAKELGWKEILCEVREVTEDDAKAICYRRNRERGNIDPFKEARLFQSEVVRQRSQKEIAEKYLVERSTVAHRLSLLRLDEEVIESVSKVPRGTITPSHLEPIASLEPADQKELVKELVAKAKSGYVDPVHEIAEDVSRIKKEREEERQLAEALKTAKFPKCPKCGSLPDDIYFKGLPWVKDEHWDHIWNLETGNPLYKEEHVQQHSLDGKSEVRVSSVLRSMHTVKELRDAFNKRIQEIVPLLTEISGLRVTGMLDNAEFHFDINTYSKTMSAYVRHGGNDLSFRAEEHDYRTGEKSSVHCGTPQHIEKVKQFIESAFQGKLDIEPRKRKKKDTTQ